MWNLFEQVNGKDTKTNLDTSFVSIYLLLSKDHI